MKIIIYQNREVYKEDSKIGNDSENKVETLEFEFPEEYKDFTKYIEFQIKGEKYVDLIENDKYTITRAIAKYGKIKAQIVLRNSIENDVAVFKSDVFELKVSNSINATIDVPIEYPTWIDNLTRLKQDIEQSEEGRVLNENERVKAEQSRADNETERAEAFTQMQKDTEEAIDNIKDMTETYNANAAEKTNEFNENAQEKIDEYNANVKIIEPRIVELENENAMLKSQFPTGEAEGNPIHIADSSDLSCEIILMGNTEQEVTTQVNLFNKIDTLSAIGGTSGYISTNYIPVKIGDTIKKNNTTTLFFYNSSKTQLGSTAGWTTGTISLENVAYIRCNILETDIDTFMIVKNQDLPSEYVEFVYNSPSPDYPSEITTVGASGSVEITIANKNIIDIEKFKALDERNIYETYNGVECLKLRGIAQTYVVNGKENQQYTFQFNIVGHTHTAAIGGFILHYSDGTNSTLYPGIGTGKFTITSTANKTLIDITWNAWSAGNYIYIDKNSMQLEVGSVATDLIPRESQKVSLPIQQEFVKIGDYEDTFVKQNGKWYEAHYSPKFVFDGTGTWSYDSQRYRFYRTIPRAIYTARAYALSSHFKNGNTETENNTFNAGTTQIFFRDERITSSTNWKDWLAEQYTNGTPLEVYYVHETPELIECTAEQEQILNSFHTYKNITNISVNGIASLKVNYKKDLETINKNNEARIAALEAALVS